jgi:hypothetical protein
LRAGDNAAANVCCQKVSRITTPDTRRRDEAAFRRLFSDYSCDLSVELAGTGLASSSTVAHRFDFLL